MVDQKLILAKHRLKKAQSTYKDGLILINSGSYTSAINRFYYAAYYGTRALLGIKELDASKHSGVISLFQLHFVKTGIFNKEVAKVLSLSFEMRQDTDYEDFFEVNKEDSIEISQGVCAFLAECKKVLTRHEYSQ